MRTLSEGDAAALLDVVADLARLDDPLAFPPPFLAALAALVGVDNAVYNELDRPNRDDVLLSAWCDGVACVEAHVADPDDPYWRLRDSHPCCSYRERTGDWTTPHAVSDFATMRQFHGTAIWNELYREEGIDYWLDVGLPVHRGHTRVFIFTNGTRDFGTREKLLLELLHPHLVARAERVETTAAAVEALAAVEDEGGWAHDVVLATAGGTIEFAAAQTRALLSRYFGTTNGRLPDALLRGGTVVVRRPDGTLTVRTARVDGLSVLLLAEDDARVERLTPRQREILADVADGLTDAQIGERLGIAAATVNKHLESIFRRLDVHNRTSAAALYRH